MAIDTLSVSQELYLDSFRRSLRAKNVAERTVQTYCESVSQFGDFLASRGMPIELENIHREHVKSFIENLLSRFKPATRSRRHVPRGAIILSLSLSLVSGSGPSA